MLPEERFRVLTLDLLKNLGIIADNALQMYGQAKLRAWGANVTDLNEQTIQFLVVTAGNSPAKFLVKEFIRASYPCWPAIHGREGQVFADKLPVIFGDVPFLGGVLRAASQLLMLTMPNGARVVPPNNIDNIWIFLHTLVKVSLKYIKENPSEFADVLSQISLTDVCRMWGVN